MKPRQCEPGDVFRLPGVPTNAGFAVAVRVTPPRSKNGTQSVIWYAVGIPETRRAGFDIQTIRLTDVVAISLIGGNDHLVRYGWSFVGRLLSFAEHSWPVFPQIGKNNEGAWLDTSSLYGEDFDASFIETSDMHWFQQEAGGCGPSYLSQLIVPELKAPRSTRHGVRYTEAHLAAYRKYEDRFERVKMRILKKDAAPAAKKRVRIAERKSARGSSLPQLWEVIERSRTAEMTVKGGKRVFLKHFRRELRDLERATVRKMAKTLVTELAKATTWKMWGAGYIMNGGCSEDGFLYFRLWLMAQGREVFRAAVAKPESLVNATLRLGQAGDFEFEELLEAFDDALEQVDEGDLSDQISEVATPPGNAPFEMTSAVLKQRYPLLYAKWGDRP